MDTPTVTDPIEVTLNNQDKQVHLRRKEPKKGQSHLPAPVIVAARRKLGAHFVGRGPLRPLTPVEEKKYLINEIGQDPDSREWEKACRDYWNNFFIDVPSEGVVLNIGLYDGEPVNIGDWIQWRWVCAHKLVADSEEKAASDPLKQYFIFDPEAEDNNVHNRNKVKKLAYTEFIRLTTGESTEKEAKINWVFRMLTGVSPDRMSKIQKENQLEALASTEPGRFYAVITDKDLEVRSVLQEMITLQILNRIGNHVFFGDNKLGETLEEAIEYYKSAKNSEPVAMLNAQLQEKRAMLT